jgi:hypothetical protein
VYEEDRSSWFGFCLGLLVLCRRCPRGREFCEAPRFGGGVSELLKFGSCGLFCVELGVREMADEVDEAETGEVRKVELDDFRSERNFLKCDDIMG